MNDYYGELLWILGYVGIFIVAGILIIGMIIIVNGYGYQDICQRHGINGVVKCGIVAPNFGSEVNLDIETGRNLEDLSKQELIEIIKGQQ